MRLEIYIKNVEKIIPKGSQNGAKMEPKCSPGRPKIDKISRLCPQERTDVEKVTKMPSQSSQNGAKMDANELIFGTFGEKHRSTNQHWILTRKNRFLLKK